MRHVAVSTLKLKCLVHESREQRRIFIEHYGCDEWPGETQERGL